ncbi:MAG: VWA domain-containing protein [Treponema sp.]|nr:VWA domain-containing protein [Treponema sp.]
MKCIKSVILFFLFILLAVNIYAQDSSSQNIIYSKKQQQLKIGADDICILDYYNDEKYGLKKNNGYHLFIKKRPEISSVLLTETVKDPEGKITNYAYRADFYNKINGDEIRYLDGKILDSETSKYSLVDSTVEQTDFFGEAFHIYIPKKLKYGYEWGRNGEIKVEQGTFINIRTFEKPYADYSGDFLDNPFLFRFYKNKKDNTINLSDNYNPQANMSFKELTSDVTYSKNAESLVTDIQSLIKELKIKDNCDLLFAIDATGSMKDDINQIQKNLVPMLQSEFEKENNIRFGLLFYRDYGDSYSYNGLPVKIFGFTTNYDLFSKNLNSIKILGLEGGDIPEAVYEALYASEQYFEWDNKNSKHIILIGDAPAHEKPKGTKKITREMVIKIAEEKNINLHCILLPMN